MRVSQQLTRILKLEMFMLKQIVSFMLIALVAVSCGKTKQSQQQEVKAPGTNSWAENAVIYEVNIRQYTPEGTFNAFAGHLPRLKELGVDVLWLMPVNPISQKNKKGTLGSYYAVQDYQKVNPEFGTMDDFKSLVDKAHALGFKVILDWVANHTGWDNPLIDEHPDWYTHKDGQIVSPVEDWADVADLNYDNRDLRKYMIESLVFWVKEAGIDGYRCDMAGMVPTDFWEDARVELDKVKPVFMLAEAWEPELTVKAFDASYGWDLHHLMNDLAQGKKDGTALAGYFGKIDTLYPERTMIMNFIDNHDENSWQGAIRERMGDAHKVFAVMAYTVPGIPLIYTGQEAGLDRRLEFFEKDQVDWNKDQELAVFYQQLDLLKHNNKALAAGERKGAFTILEQDNERGVFAFERSQGNNRVVVLLNLTDMEQKFAFETPIGGEFKDLFKGDKTTIAREMILSPNAYAVFVKE